MIRDLLERLRALVFRRRWQAELDEELRFHLEQDVAARIAAGADPATARQAARVAFGGVDRYREEARDASGVRPLDDVIDDARFAVRALTRNPGFAATAILVLAIAIGATTAVWSVVRTVLIADLPYPRPDRLVRVYQQNSITNRWSLSVVDFQAIRDQQTTLDAFGVSQSGFAAFAGAGVPEQIRVTRATSGIFRAFGARAAVGRLIEPTDEPVGAPPVVVVSAAFAAARFGGPDRALGKSVTLDGVAHTVVGVLPSDIQELGGMAPAAWPVLQLAPPARRGPFGLRGIGLMKPGVTLEDAARDLAGISKRIFPIWQAGFRDTVARLTPFPLRDTMVGTADRQLWLFAGAVGLVLLVAVANVATLTLVRAAARGHELAVRTTLGATRRRLAQLVITESLVLTIAAAVAGIGVAAVGLGLVSRIAPNLPRAREIGLDGNAVLLALALGLVSGLLVSVSPVASVLTGARGSARGDTRRTGGTRHTGRIRGVLVAAEFAFALPLLLGAALLGRSFLRLQHVDPGYDAAATFSVSLALPAARYPDVANQQDFWRRVVARALETPGVVAAGLSDASPPDNQGASNNFNLIRHPVPPGESEPVSPWADASPGYFAALGVPLLDGRLYTERDTLPVVVVSRAWAEHYFPGERAVGEELIEGGCYDCPHVTIVGIVGDVKYQGLAGDGDGVYAPITQSRTRTATLFVRTAAPPERFIEPVLAALRSLDPELPLAGVTLTEQLRRALADPGRWTAVLSAFAAVALVLAGIGIFGLMSYVVRRQRREIGVRMALGADPRQVTGMIVARGMRYVMAGAAVGLALAFVEGRWLAALLYGVTARDPVTMLGATVLLLAAALVACLVPGLRAARIRPIEAIADE